MNNTISKLVTFVLLCALLVSSIRNVGAADAYTQDEFSTEFEELINRYSASEEITYTISEQKEILGVGSSKTYIYCELEPYGYAIVTTSGLLMEACYEDGSELPFHEYEDNLFYGGPGCYFVQQDGVLLDALDKDVVDNALLVDCGSRELRCAETRAKMLEHSSTSNAVAYSIRSSVTQIISESYFSSLEQYGTNTAGTCTVLATAILLGYYDYALGYNTVATKYRDGVGTTEDFHQLLNDYVYGQEAQSGRFINEITSAINTYLATCTSIRMYYSINTDTAQYATNRIVNCINNGKPVVASMSTGLGSSWDHTCLVYGILYSEAAPASSLVYRVHMGWHQTAYNTYTAYAGWFYECGYLQ